MAMASSCGGCQEGLDKGMGGGSLSSLRGQDGCAELRWVWAQRLGGKLVPVSADRMSLSTQCSALMNLRL